MTYTLTSGRTPRGFALPTVLIASVVMLTILIAAVGASSSIRNALNVRYYNQLAREASESGAVRARECLEANGYVPQWTNAQQLHPNTSCSGGSACSNSANCFVVSRDNIRTTFSVEMPIDQTVSQIVNVTSKVELLRTSNGGVWQTYTNKLSARVGRSVSFNNVRFGFHLQGGGGAYFATIGSDGKMRTAGNNIFGQLGNGTMNSTLVPTPIVFPAGVVPAKVYTGFQAQGTNTYITTTAGDVYGFGKGEQGQLGNGVAVNQSTPVQFGLSGAIGTSVTANDQNTFVLTQSGDIYSAGQCWHGSLGTGYSILNCADQSIPQRVGLPAYNAGDANTHPTSDVVADAYSVFVRMEGGRVYGWGRNQDGQLGAVPAVFPETSNPVQIGTYGDLGEPEATQIAFDGHTLYIVDDKGKINAVGGNLYGEIGDGTTIDRFTPTPFQLLPSAGKARKVTTDLWFASVLTCANPSGACVNGEVWSAGLNEDGQLGDGGTATVQSTPVKFQLPVGVKAIDVYTTSIPQYNTFVVGDDGNIYGAGRNDFGQLGDGTTTATSAATPVKMMQLPLGVQGLEVQSGFNTTVVLASDSRVYTVGNNSDGQLGDGTTTNSSIPRANNYINVLPINYY